MRSGTSLGSDKICISLLADTVRRIDILLAEVQNLQINIVSILRISFLYKYIDGSLQWGDNWHEASFPELLTKIQETYPLFPSPKELNTPQQNPSDFHDLLADIWNQGSWSRGQKRNYHALRASQVLKRRIIETKLFLFRISVECGITVTKNADGKHHRKPFQLMEFLIGRSAAIGQIEEYITLVSNQRYLLNKTLDSVLINTPKPSIERRRELGMSLAALADKTMYTARDLYKMLKAIGVIPQEYSYKRAITVHTWVHSLHSRNTSLKDAQFSPMTLGPDDVNDTNLQSHHNDETVHYVTTNYAIPERNDLQPILTHEVAHQVIMDYFSEFDGSDYAESEDQFTNLISDINWIHDYLKKSLIETGFRNSKPVFREIGCDILATSLDGTAYIFALFTEIFGHGHKNSYGQTENQILGELYFDGKNFNANLQKIIQDSLPVLATRRDWLIRLKICLLLEQEIQLKSKGSTYTESEKSLLLSIERLLDSFSTFIDEENSTYHELFKLSNTQTKKVLAKSPLPKKIAKFRNAQVKHKPYISELLRNQAKQSPLVKNDFNDLNLFFDKPQQIPWQRIFCQLESLDNNSPLLSFGKLAKYWTHGRSIASISNEFEIKSHFTPRSFLKIILNLVITEQEQNTLLKNHPDINQWVNTAKHFLTVNTKRDLSSKTPSGLNSQTQKLVNLLQKIIKKLSPCIKSSTFQPAFDYYSTFINAKENHLEKCCKSIQKSAESLQINYQSKNNPIYPVAYLWALERFFWLGSDFSISNQKEKNNMIKPSDVCTSEVLGLQPSHYSLIFGKYDILSISPIIKAWTPETLKARNLITPPDDTQEVPPHFARRELALCVSTELTQALSEYSLLCIIPITLVRKGARLDMCGALNQHISTSIDSVKYPEYFSALERISKEGDSVKKSILLSDGWADLIVAFHIPKSLLQEPSFRKKFDSIQIEIFKLRDQIQQYFMTDRTEITWGKIAIDNFIWSNNFAVRTDIKLVEDRQLYPSVDKYIEKMATSKAELITYELNRCSLDDFQIIDVSPANHVNETTPPLSKTPYLAELLKLTECDQLETTETYISQKILLKSN